MGKLIDFDNDDLYGLCKVPKHSQDSLENYLVRGFEPGGFMEAMLAGDLFRAANIADSINGPNMQNIARWISGVAPWRSWGSYERVADWCNDIGGHRTAFKDKLEKVKIMEILNT